jgi:hypothetical protein
VNGGQEQLTMKKLSLSVFVVMALALVAGLALFAFGHPVHVLPFPELADAGSLGMSGMGLAGAGLMRNYVSNVQNVAANSTAVIKLGTGGNAPTVDKLQLTLSGTTMSTAKIAAIRAYANGREFFVDASATKRNLRRAYMGLPVVTSELVLDFTEPNAKTQIEQNLSSIPLALLSDFRVELDITSAVAPAIQCLAHVRAPTANPFIKKIRKINHKLEVGQTTVYVPFGSAGSKLLRVWIDETTDQNVTAIELRAKNSIGYEGSRTQLQNSQSVNGLSPQANLCVLDFIEDGNLSGWFDTSKAQDVELRLTAGTAEMCSIYYEWLDPIDHL